MSSASVVKELIELSFSVWVLPFTVLLLLCCLYWLLAVLGTIDMDTLDIDLDVDADADMDLDVDGDVGNSNGFFVSALKMVNATEVPLMLVVSLITLCMWFISLVAASFLKENGSWWVILLSWFIGFIISCVITALVTKPLIPFFRAFNAGENDDEPVIGSETIVDTSQLTDKFGQCRVIRERGADALINCKLVDGEAPAKKGEKVIIIGKDDESGLYLAKRI